MARADALLAQAIEDDVDAIIDTAFRFALTPQNIFLGHLRPVRDGVTEEAIFVEQSGGAGIRRHFGDLNINLINVQVLYRGPIHDVDVARKTADQIHNALEKVEIANIIYVHALESAPMAAGLNSNERSVFSMNYEVARPGIK